MEYRVGDTIFNYAGRPGVIADRKPENDEYVIKPEAESLKAIQKRGYINGLSQEMRQEFYDVMDKIREIQEPEKQVNELAAKIDEKQKLNPSSRLVAKYLNAEMQHIMTINNIRNREYTIDALKVNE